MNQQSRLQFNRILTILLIICLSLPGTAFGTPIGNKGKKNFDQGKKYEVAQQWDLAAQEFSQAVAADPGNAEYRLHLLRSLTNASIMFMKRGDELIQQNDQSSAYNAYRQAVSYDPTNELAKLKMDRIIEQQKALASGAEPIKVSSTGNVMPGSTIETAARPQRPGDLLQNVAFRDTKFKTLVTSLSNQLGLNVIMDESVKDSSVSLNLQNTTLPKALDSLLLMTKHTFEQVDRKTIFVYQDNPTNRQRFERLMLKTFYLGNANPDDVTRLVTSMLTGTAKQAQALKQQNALVVRASAADMKVIQQLIGMLDKNRPEVVLDVEIYEVSHSAKLQIGNQLSTTANQISSPAVTKKFNVTENGVTKEVTETTPAANTLISGLGQLGGFMLNPGAAAAAGLLGAKIGSFGFIGLPPSSLSLLQSKANSKLLNRTQIHALDGEPNETKVGKKVPVTLGGGYPGGFVGSPVPTTTTTVGGVQSGINNLGQLGGLGGFGGGFGSGFYNNIQYQDVGLVIKVTPTITNDGYVQVKMDLTSSNVEPAASESERLTPTFTQRSLTTISRIADGRTAVVAGVQQQSDGTSRSSVPFLGMVPILGRLFTTPNQDASNSDIIITVTPHVIRSAAINKEDHLATYIGSLGGGNTISIEDVVSRAQVEDDQERRIIAAERRNQGEQVAAAPPTESALVAVTTEPRVNPQPKVEVTSDPIPSPVQTQSASLTQPPRPAGAQTTTFTPAPTPAMAGPSGHSTVQNAVAPARPQPTPTPVVNNVVVSESGSRNSGQNNRENDNQEPDVNDAQQAVPQPPPDVKPARMSSMSRPEQIEKARREEADREAKAREDLAKDPVKARAEAERQKALEEEMIRQYLKEVPKPPKNITPATIQPAAKPKPKSGEQPAENKPGNPSGEQSKAPAQAAESGGEVVELNMMPTTIKGQVGKSFILVLSLDGQASMTGANISLKYDPAMLQVRAVRDGGLLGKRPDITHQIDGGNLLISMQQVSDREGPVKASGKLLIVEFTALANGNTAIDVNRGDTHLLMSGGRGAQINATAARVQISGEAISRLSNEQ